LAPSVQMNFLLEFAFQSGLDDVLVGRGRMTERVLVLWSDSAALADNWEDKAALCARFPEAEAWGQASSQGEGDDSGTNMLN
jgi:hypothetical protein